MSNRIYIIQSDMATLCEIRDYALSLEAAETVLKATGYVCTQEMDDDTNFAAIYEHPGDFLCGPDRVRIVWRPALK